MLQRYTVKPFDHLWSDQCRVDTWRAVEIAAAFAKDASVEILDQMSATPVPTLDEIEAAESVTRHDVMAFLTLWRARMPSDAATWVHRDMTSSDLVDTANSVRILTANREILDELNTLLYLLAAHGLAHWNAPRLARTHGQAAEATTWGYRVAGFVAGLQRSVPILARAGHNATPAKLSGPVGNYRYTTPQQEAKFARSLGLHPVGVATQIVNRDVYGDWVYALARTATMIEQIALEVRLSQRSEIDELREGFTKGQTGSSSMPHKRNPITSENLTGLARLVRAQLEPIMGGVASHHERDISHSSVERIALPTASTLTHYMLVQCQKMILNLYVNEGAMLANLEAAGPDIYSAWARNHDVNRGINPDVAWHTATPSGGDLPPQPQPNTRHVERMLERVISRYRENVNQEG